MANASSHWEEALRDDTNNGCVGDYCMTIFLNLSCQPAGHGVTRDDDSESDSDDEDMETSSEEENETEQGYNYRHTNSHNWFPYRIYNCLLENLELDQEMMSSLILMTCLL